MRMTNCQRCGIEIPKLGSRKYCTKCRKLADDERYQSHRKETKDEKIKKLLEENKKLKVRIDELEKCNLNLQERLDRKEELNKSYRKEIKDHQLYEEKLEHRIIEFEELLH